MNLYEKELNRLTSQGLLRTLPHDHLICKWVDAKGKKLLNLNSNDYLGLQARQDLWEDFLSTAHRFAPSSSSSRLLTGNSEIFWTFEEELHCTYGTESALLWDSGYHANSGAIPVLAQGNVLFLADRLVHASIIDGIRLSGARFARFRHNDTQHLKKLLETNAPSYDAIWIITESLFSMDGDLAPLSEIVALKKQFPNTFLYLDEAHAVGVFGNQGLGLAEQAAVINEIDLLLGTFGKALCSQGAFTLQSKTLRELFVNHARPLIYSTALPPVMVAWSQFIFTKMQEMTSERNHLKSLINSIKAGHPSQIIPILVPGNNEATVAAQRLRENGYYLRPIRKPTVPEGKERLRISLTAAMTSEELAPLKSLLPQIKTP